MKTPMFLLLVLLAPCLFAQSTGGSTNPTSGPLIKWNPGAYNITSGSIAPGAVRFPIQQMEIKRYAAATTPTSLVRYGANTKGTMGASFVLQYELWEDVNADGALDAGDVQIGQSYDGNFTYTTLAAIQPGQIVHILLTVDIDASAPTGTTLKVITPRQPYAAYPYYFDFSTSQTEFGSLVTAGQVSFGGVQGGPLNVDYPPAPVLQVSDSTGTFSTGSTAAGDRDFGNVDVANMPTAYAQFTVANTGNADLQLGTPTITSTDFVLDVTAFSTLVTPGTSTTFGVAFDAAMIGAKTAIVEFTNSAGANFSFEVAGVAVSSNFPVITVSALPEGMEGSAYAPFNLPVSGGTGGCAFTVVAGALPTGMQLSATGDVTGTPATGGSYQLTVRVTDSVGAYSEQALSLDVAFDLVGDKAAGSGDGGGCVAGHGALWPLLALLLLGAAIGFRRKIFA